MAKNPNFNKRASNNNNFKKPTNNKRPAYNKKPKFTKVKVEIAASDFYAENIDSLYNLLASISFDKVAVPVKINKSELFGKSDLKGTVTIGTIDKFNNDNTFTVLLTEENSNCITEDHVMNIRCKKDWATNEFTYCSEFRIMKGESINAQYKDIEEAFQDADEDTNTEETDSVETAGEETVVEDVETTSESEEETKE